ncbi:MYCBP-associated protein isoform X2 [Amia ocellicauda]
MTRVLVRRSRPVLDERRRVKVTVARPIPPDAPVQLLDYTGPGGPRFDAQGMVLPHSILGSLVDFKRQAEARGDTELAKRVPSASAMRGPEEAMWSDSQRAEATLADSPSPAEPQSHALRHWERHMAERRRQQDFLSRLLQKPVPELVMNQAGGFRAMQEQRELISRGLPALQDGQGLRVGSEFWSLPLRLGDELSGITATLSQRERGNLEPIAHIGQPRSLRLETGNILPGEVDRRPRGWDQSLYLQQRRQELRAVLQELDFSQPEIDGLEVIGSGQPFTCVSAECCPLQEQVTQEGPQGPEEPETQDPLADSPDRDPLADYPDVMMEALLLPSLQFCGQPARWIGSCSSHKGEVGVAARLTFEAMAGDQASSHLELSNDGSTAIYYSWQRLPIPHSFRPNPRDVHKQNFYFNSSPGVILPGDTQQILFTFKSQRPGVFSEVWALNPHPVLLGGAVLQVTLRGVALHQDKTADAREALQRELQRREAETVAEQILREVLQGVRTPERPGSPPELYVTEEQSFCQQNPQLQYDHMVVQSLNRLWEECVGSEVTEPWDLSIPHFREAMLAMTDDEEGVRREAALGQLNALVLQLCQPPIHTQPDLLHLTGLQLWREVLDGLVSQAALLRQVLGLPERDAWGEQLQEEALPSVESGRAGKAKREDKVDRRGALSKDEKKGGIGKDKEEKKGAGKQPGKDRPEDRPPSKKGRVQEEKRVGKPATGPAKELVSSAESLESELPEIHEPLDPVLLDRYRQQLHAQVYGLLGAMVESLSDLCEEVKSSEPPLL